VTQRGSREGVPQSAANTLAALLYVLSPFTKNERTHPVCSCPKAGCDGIVYTLREERRKHKSFTEVDWG